MKNKNAEPWERVQVVMDHFGLNKNSFSKEIGMTSNVAVGRIINEKRKPIRATLEKIVNRFPEVSLDWLLTGEGEMLTDKPESLEDGGGFAQGKLIPLFDAVALGGNSHSIEMISARQIEMIQIGGFLRESESALRVYGNSMTPNYPPGCIVGTRIWNERFIEPGRVYVVETRENRFLKRLYYNGDKTAYRCLSDNTMLHDSGPAKGEYCYPEFEIPLEDVFRMHKVIGVIKRSTI